MTENKRFEFREVNYSAIVPRVYDTEKQQYANLFECVYWLNGLHEENEQLKAKNAELEEDLQEVMNIIDYLLKRLKK